MEVSFTHQEVREEEAAPPPPPPQQHHHQHYQLKLCIPLVKPTTNSNHPKPLFSLFTFQFHLSKSLKNLNVKPPIFSHGSCFKPMHLTGTVINNALFSDSPSGGLFLEEEGKRVMEGFKSNEEGEGQRFHDLSEEKRRESTSSCEFLTSTGHEGEGHSHSSSEEEENSSSPSSLAWCLEKDESPESKISDNGGVKSERKTHLDKKFLEKQGSSVSEVEMMKERFSKLLLGEDMSGSGNGVCTALAISNAITNLCATLFGQLWRLEPLPHEKKAMWRREMEWLLCVCNHIVELMPSWQTFPDGTKLEVMTCRPRSDLYVNLPALRKLDNMLLEILDGFDNKEFWYVDQGILAPEADGSSSFRQSLQRQEEKWWLPVPRLPPGGLQENTRKELQHKRDSTNQILKAAMAINSITLAEMEVPELYLEALPKNGRASLGDFIYRYISTEHFNSEYLLDCLDLSSEHQAIELANQVEASIYVWRKRPNSKPANNTARVNSKSSWEMVKELMMDTDKRELLADRAESLLLSLKQRFPGLPQTTLDMSKIQYNKDVGKAILESYSRVLESLAYNIVARIDDLLHVDDLTKHSNRFSSITKLNAVAHGSVTFPYPVSVSSTPYKTAFTTPNFSPARLASPMKGERSPYVTRGKIPRSGAKKVLTDYLSIETKPKCSDSPLRAENSVQKESGQKTGLESFAFMKEAVNSISSSPMKNFSER